MGLSRTSRAWLLDGSVAAVALALTSPYAFDGRAISRLPVWSAVVIVLAMVLPLLVRRVWPRAVFAWIFLVAAATGWWALQIVWSPALVVALYTVAASRPRRDALVACGLICGASVVAAHHGLPYGWRLAAALLIAIAVAATGLGLYASTRRVLLEQLRDRAARLERERDQQGELAAAAERARIAREMHDIVAHHLTVMVALADGAAAQVTRAPEQAGAAMRSVSETGRLALADTRRVLGVLPAGLEPVPDLSSLPSLVARVRDAGLPVSYESSGASPELSPALQLTLFRVVQEALTNTLKHAGPGARATVRLTCSPEEVRVSVDDDGRGGAPSGAGRGLAGMQERVAAFGGSVHCGPRVPHGWSVSATLRPAAVPA